MKVTAREFRKVVPIGSTFFYTVLKVKIDIIKMYKVFTSDKLTTGEKRNILYKSKNLTREQKDEVWNAYMREDLIDFSNLPEIDIEEA